MNLHLHPLARGFVGVACHEHVRRGVQGGFAQVCHGRRAPLATMRPGDWLIYYSPGELMRGTADVRAFTAIGQVTEREPYGVPPDAQGFAPIRRDIVYVRSRPAPIAPLLPHLAFAQAPGTGQGKPSWGLLMRRGHFPLARADLLLIADAMGAELDPNKSLLAREFGVDQRIPGT